MAQAALARHSLGVDGRSVHLRLGGVGPPLMLLHQSPKTGEEMLPLAEGWARKFTAIIPDNPGYGLSDPLPHPWPTIDDLAAAHVALLDRLNIERVMVYGFHTGAKIALAMAALYPDRVAVAVANGVLINTAGDRQALLDRYLPPFEPQPDGSHLPQLWHRIQDQRIFFPWYDRREAARMPLDPGTPEALHQSAMDFLAAGSSYAAGYGAALSMDTKAMLARVTVPTFVTGGPGDILSKSLSQITASDSVTVAAAADLESLIAQAEGFLSRHAPRTQDIKVPVDAPPRRLAPVIQADARGRHLHGLWGGAGETVLALPDLGGSVFALERVLQPLAITHHILALDPFGSGWSDRSGDLAAALTGIAPRTVIAQGLGTLHARALIDAGAIAPQRLIVLDALFDKHGAAMDRIPDLTPDAAGGHLMRAWHAARMSRLFHPWTRPTPENAIPSDGRLGAQELHAATVDLLNGWWAGRAALDDSRNLVDWLQSKPAPEIHIIAPAWAENRADMALPPDIDIEWTVHEARGARVARAITSA